jgi:hypothetical protein
MSRQAAMQTRQSSSTRRLKLSPNSPDLLQDRAEIAIRLKDFADAPKSFAHQSWSIGPKLGPLCARNWQTVVEIRLQLNDRSRRRHRTQVGAAVPQARPAPLLKPTSAVIVSPHGCAGRSA